MSKNVGKPLEEYIEEYTGWKRETKQHYGHKIHDNTSPDGVKADCKLYKAMRIHSLLEEMEAKYGKGTIIFSKLKHTHYIPSNVIAHIRLDYFKELYDKVDKRTDVPTFENNNLTNNLKTLTYYLEQVKLLTNKMKKILKELGDY